MDQISYIALAVLGVAAMGGAILFKKAEYVINFVLRLFMGVAGIYFINTVLGMQSMESGVGINGLTCLISAALGLPGVLMTYGLSFYFAFR